MNTVELYHSSILRILLKTDFITEKMMVADLKRYFSITMPQLDGGVFPTVAERQRR